MKAKHQTAFKRIILAAMLLSSSAAAEVKLTPGIAMREGYDDNIMLQNHGDQAHRDSLVTSITPSLSLAWHGTGDWQPALTAKYSPDAVFYHADSEETYVAHNLSAALATKSGHWSIDLANHVTVVDGSHLGPTYTAPGGIPAMGGYPVRDRRDSATYRADYRMQYIDGDWLLRPVFSACIADFQTAHRATPGYENYVDRADMNAGVDVGYKAFPNTYLIAGYRFGWQNQATLLSSPVQYSNTYQRLLVGVEGKPLPWLKLQIRGGPDFRDFGPAEPDAGFGDDQKVKAYVDACITITPSPRDEIALMMRRFVQLSYCGRSVFEDITYQMTYRHDFTARLSGTLTLKDYEGDWIPPSTRNDRIYTAGVALNYRVNDHLLTEAGYSYDLAESNIPDTAGREFDRNFVWIGARYSF